MSRPVKRPRIDHQATAAALRHQPGMWQVVGDYRNRITADRTVYSIRTGVPLGQTGDALYTPAGAFEARIELVEDVTRIHARYIGGEVTS